MVVGAEKKKGLVFEVAYALVSPLIPLLCANGFIGGSMDRQSLGLDSVNSDKNIII